MPTGPTQSSIVYQDSHEGIVRDEIAAVLEGIETAWSGGPGSLHPHADRHPGVLVPPARYLDAATALRDQAGFICYIDNSAVDYPDREPERFTVVTVLMNLKTQERVLLKCRVAEDGVVPSLTSLWKAANWAERETYDMFGVIFDGHPELTRIYMPEDYDGYPMRKDFPLQGHLRFVD